MNPWHSAVSLAPHKAWPCQNYNVPTFKRVFLLLRHIACPDRYSCYYTTSSKIRCLSSLLSLSSPVLTSGLQTMASFWSNQCNALAEDDIDSFIFYRVHDTEVSLLCSGKASPRESKCLLHDSHCLPISLDWRRKRSPGSRPPTSSPAHPLQSESET